MAIIHATQVCATCYPDCPCFPIGTNEWNANHTIQNCTITNAMLAGCIAACKLACSFITDVTGTGLLDGRFWIGSGANAAVELAISGDIGVTNAGVASISSGVIVNADVNASAAIAYSKLASLSSTQIIVGSSANVPTARTVTGDVTISNTGITAIGSGVIVNADINSSAAIAYSKLASLSSTQLLVGSSSNVATARTITGDVTINNTGVTAIASGVIINADVNACAAIAGSKLDIDVAEIADVTITGVAAGEILKYTCCGWVNNTLSEAGVSATCHTHTESDITDLQSYLLNIVEDTTPQLGGALDGQGEDLNNLGVIFLTEQANAEVDVAGKGQFWVKTATPNLPFFTDDAGTDFQIATLTGTEIFTNKTLTSPILTTPDLNGSTFTLDADGDLIFDASVDDVLTLTIPDDTVSSGFSISNTDGSITISNGTGTANLFKPQISGLSAGSSQGTQFIGAIQVADDTGCEPVFRINARQVDLTPVVTRPLFAIANDATEQLQVTAAGNLNMLLCNTVQEGGTDISPIGKHDIWVGASAMWPSETSGSRYLNRKSLASGIDYQTLCFDDTCLESAQFDIRFPKQWNAGTVTYEVHWSLSGAVCTGVTWGLEAFSVADDGGLNGTYGCRVDIDDTFSGTANDLMITAESAALTINGAGKSEQIHFKITRQVGDANDNTCGDARLLGVMLHLTTDASNSD